MPADVRYQILVDQTSDQTLTDALSEVEVEANVDRVTEFRLRFAIDITHGNFSLVDDERLFPGKDREITVIAALNGENSVLAHGVLTEREVSLMRGGAGSWLELRGRDRRVVMARDGGKRAIYRGTVSTTALQILASHGFIPDVEIGVGTLYSDLGSTLNQASSDLAFIERLAGENGFRFWIDWQATPRPFGLVVLEVAHFKTSPPEGFSSPGFSLPIGGGKVVLQLNPADRAANISSFHASRRSEVPRRSGSVSRVDLDSARVERTSVSGPTTNTLGDEPPHQGLEQQFVSAGGAAEARQRMQAAINDASWSVQAQVETSLHALGRLVRPHDIIQVSGGGSADDGDYFVAGVSHHVNPAEHRVQLSLWRNAVGSSGLLGGLL